MPLKRTGTLRLVRTAFDAKPVIVPTAKRKKAAEQTDRGEVTLQSIAPNAGIAAAYRDELQELTRAMTVDILRKIKTHFPGAQSRLAVDDDPIVTLRKVLVLWGKRWTRRFDEMSADIAEKFASSNQRYTDAQFRKRLKDAGFTVSFKPTERQLSAYRAVVAENVGLIRSIPQQLLKDVQSQVWTAVTTGKGAGELSTQIRKSYGVSYRRAALIARDQVAKSKATLENARRAEIGITQAIWRHSSAGKTPRPTHVRMDGKTFEISKGMYDSHEQRDVQPGELINCRCTSRAIIPARLSR